MLCNECNKRDKCTELCKKAEKYADQDYIPPMESVVKYNDSNDYDAVFSDIDDPKNITNKEEIIIFEYFLKGGKFRKTQQQIADILGLSQPYINKIIKKYRETLRKNLQN